MSVNTSLENGTPTPKYDKQEDIYYFFFDEKNNFPARMMRPALSIDFCQPDRPGILITSAEVDFLLAEAITKGWNVPGTANNYFENGIKSSVKLLNDHYLTDDALIAQTDIDNFVASIMAANPLATADGAREAINLQAWILHLMNPAEGWANLRRADYPVLEDRTKLDKFISDFTYDDENLTTPVRLCYPILEKKYNGANYQEALDRMGGKDNWHHRVWWDKYDMTTVKWLADDKEVFVGTAINKSFEAGDYSLKIVAVTNKGKETSRTLKLQVKPCQKTRRQAMTRPTALLHRVLP